MLFIEKILKTHIKYVLNNYARTAFRTTLLPGRYSHAQPLIHRLLWLPVQQRIRC